MPTRRSSIADLARTLRLSPSTISRALSGAAVREATRQRVRQLAQELRYQPNPAAVALRRGYSNTLGILLPGITGSVFPEVVAGNRGRAPGLGAGRSAVAGAGLLVAAASPLGTSAALYLKHLYTVI